MEAIVLIATVVLVSLASIEIFRVVVIVVAEVRLTWRQALKGWFTFSLGSSVAATLVTAAAQGILSLL
ncbi:MAG: hypothetical protein K5872_22960 [Rhizobiaceae bacterium]|nr:hypothetical protein [Rhizobiaceae bacterium]